MSPATGNKFSKKETLLKIEANSSYYRENVNNNYSNIYKLNNHLPSFDNTSIPQGNYLQQISINYSNQFFKNLKIVAGNLRSYSQQDFNFYAADYQRLIAVFVTDEKKTKHFIYKESANTVYTAFRHSIKKLSYSGELRLEPIKRTSNLVNKDSIIRNTILSFIQLYILPTPPL